MIVKACAPTLAIAATALALCSCGGGGAASNASAGAMTTTASDTAISGWKATDACAMMDKSVVAATLGSAVQSATLGAVKDEGNGFPLYSQCEFLLADGRMLVFGTGQYTNGADLAGQLGDMRRQAKMISDKSPADVPGLGKAALWVADVGALYVFFGDGRYASATVAQTDVRNKQDGPEKVQADDTAILRKAGA